jgi:MFS transporter, OFA family, oxalate/formate antiporter
MSRHWRHRTHVSSSVVFLGATALSVTLVFSNAMNGIARPFFGWVSDRIGLSTAMAIAFGLGAGSYFLLSVTGSDPWGFIFFVGMDSFAAIQAVLVMPSKA